METQVKDLSIEQLSEVSNRYIRGEGLYHIAQAMGIPYPLVLVALQEVYDNLKKSVSLRFDDARIVQLSKLDKTESEAWNSWELSKRPKQKKSSKATKLGGISSTESPDKPTPQPDKMDQQINTEEREGSVAYLNIVLLCIKTRVDLLRLK